MSIEHDTSIIGESGLKGGKPDDEFFIFRTVTRKTGPGLRLFAKWPAMEEFMKLHMVQNYGDQWETSTSLLKHPVHGWRIYPLNRAIFDSINYHIAVYTNERESLFAQDSYVNVWWAFAQGLKDGIKWTMRFPPDFKLLESYVNELRSFSIAFANHVMREHSIELVHKVSLASKREG